MEAAGRLPLSLRLLTGMHVMRMETDYGQPNIQMTNGDPGEKLVLLVLEGNSAAFLSLRSLNTEPGKIALICRSAWQPQQAQQCQHQMHQRAKGDVNALHPFTWVPFGMTRHPMLCPHQCCRTALRAQCGTSSTQRLGNAVLQQFPG